MEIKLPVYVKSILNGLNECGYAAYVVGGCVRDSILGVEPKDWDITTDATPDQIESLFAQTIPTGKKYGTITVVWTSEDGMVEEHCEVTTFRADGKYSDGRRPDEVTFGKDIVEDLSRRDFTMNAMAYNELVGLVDPFDGQGALIRKELIAVGKAEDRFREDALRMLRAVRFAFKYNLKLSSDIVKALSIGVSLHLLDNVSKERIHDELIKILEYSANRAEHCDSDVGSILGQIFNTDVLYMPEILDLNFAYTTKIFLILQDLDYPLYEVEIWLRKYKFSNYDIKTVIALFKIYEFIGIRVDIDETFADIDYSARLMLNKFSIKHIDEYMELYDEKFAYKEAVKNNINAPVHISDLNISGYEIKEIFRKNKYAYENIEVGVCLNCLMETVLKDKTKNTSSILKKLVKEWISDTDKKN